MITRTPVQVVPTSRATVIVRGMTPPPAAALDRITADPDARLFVVAADPPLTVNELVAAMKDELPAGCTAVRLVLSFSARDNLAQTVADRLRITVHAPSGWVLLLASGNLFVTDGEWQSFRPGKRSPGRHGIRHPAPHWQAGLGVPAAPKGFVFTPIPAGLWLHPVAYAPAELPASVLAVPGNRERLIVLTGHPQAPPIPADQAYQALLGLPGDVRRRLALIPYGPDSTIVHRLAERLAEQTGAEVEVVSGVPDTDEQGRTVFTTVTSDGRRGWRPYGEWFVYPGSAVPSVRQSRSLVAGTPPQAATQHLGYGWGLETVRSGWFARAEDGDPDGDIARRVPPLAAHPILVLGAAAVNAPDALEWLVGRVTGEMPPELSSSVRLLLTRPPADGGAAAWRRLTQTYGDFLRLGDDGSLRRVSTIGRVAEDELTAAVRIPAPEVLVAEPTMALARPKVPAALPDLAAEPTVALARPDVPAASVALADLADLAAEPTMALARPEVLVAEPTTALLRPAPGPVAWWTATVEPLDARRWQLSEVDDLPVPEPDRTWSHRSFQAERDNLAGAARAAAAVLARMPQLTPAEREDAELELTALAAVVTGVPAKAMGGLLDAAAAGLRRLPIRAGAFLAAWDPPAAGWRPGRTYAAEGLLGAGHPGEVAEGGRMVAVWSSAARPLPVQLGATPGVRMVPPRTRFVVSAVTPGAVLLHEVLDDASPRLTARIQTSLRRTAEAWRRSPAL